MARFCGKCGTELPEQAKFCRKCGFRMDLLEARTAPEIDELKTELMPAPPSPASSEPKQKPRRQTVAIPPEDFKLAKPIKREPVQPPLPQQPPIFSQTTHLDPIPLTETPPPQPPATEILQSTVKAAQPTVMSNPQPKPHKQTAPPAPPELEGHKRTATPPPPVVHSNAARKWLPLVIPAVLLAAVCIAFFVFNSRESVAETAQVSPTPVVVEATPTPVVASEPAPSPTPTPVVESTPNAVAAARKTPTPKALAAAATPTPAATPQETALKVLPTPTILARIEAQPTPKPAASANSRRLTADEHLRQGIASLNAGGFAEALSEFEKVRSLAPGNVDVFYLIGQAHHRMGQTAQALAAYKQCTSGVYAGVAQNHVLLLDKKKKEKY
jgi:hypothetical protein